jgi:hypothetical protein
MKISGPDARNHIRNSKRESDERLLRKKIKKRLRKDAQNLYMVKRQNALFILFLKIKM